MACVDDLEAAQRRIEELEGELGLLEQRLSEMRERSDAFTRIVESIDHHVYINEVLPDGGRRTLFAGPGRDRLLGGVPADGDWGRAWIDAVHPDDRALYAEHTARYLRGEISEVRCRMVGSDGVTRWIIGGGAPRRLGERLIIEGIVRDATAEVAAEEQLREAARTDSLTGLFNRRHFSEVLDAELERSRREQGRPGLVTVDVDHFKSINDTYGHQLGDSVLVEVAQRLQGAVRAYDCIARWGGEEFTVLAPASPALPRPEPAIGARRIRWRLARRASTPREASPWGGSVRGRWAPVVSELLAGFTRSRMHRARDPERP